MAILAASTVPEFSVFAEANTSETVITPSFVRSLNPTLAASITPSTFTDAIVVSFTLTVPPEIVPFVS